MIAASRPALDWNTRPRRERTIAAERTIWQTSCGRFRVVRSASLYGLPLVFYALAIGEFGEWRIVGRHRKRGPAIDRCGEVFRNSLQRPRRGVS